MISLKHQTGLIFDLFFCIVFMPLLVLVGPVHFWWHNFPLFTAIVIAYLYASYFATKFLELPKLILLKSYYKLGIIAACALIMTYVVTLYPLPAMDFVIPSMSEYQTRVRNYNIAISIWFMFSVVMIYSLTVAFVKELYERLLLQTLAEKQRNEAKLAVFKAQISPHFLFNTLNSLYSLVVGTSDKAEDAFIKFTEILKYSYTTIENEQEPLREEVHYIQNYIDLQQIRLDKHTEVTFYYETDNEDALIPPMIFLTFVENAFKYGASTSQDCSINISLKLHEGILLFTTENRVVKHEDKFRTDMPTGLNNCRNRLAGLFPGKHELKTIEENSLFKIFLTLNLN